MNLTKSWKDFYNEFEEIFKNSVAAELALAATFEESYIYRENSFLKDLLHILKYAVFSCINLKKYYLPSKSYKGIFAINLARQNDFGLIFPILEKYEKREEPLLIIKKDCFEKEIDNIMKLNRTKILFKEDLKPSFTLLGFTKSVLEALKAVQTLKQHTLDNSFYRNYLKKRQLAFIKNYLYLTSLTNALKKNINFSKTDFIFSLGERRYGLIAHQQKIKHIAYQHGSFSTKSISYWPMFTPGNVNEIFVYGNHYKSIVEKVFPDNINKVKVFGNSSYDGNATKNIHKKNDCLKIVFFSSTHGYLKIDEELVNNSLDCLVNLKKEFNNRLDLKIKLHPNESDEYILNYNGLFGNDIKLYNDSIPLKEIFENTDICFAWTSSTNLEGVFFNCIAVQLNLGKFELSMQDFSKRINNYEELVLFIAKLNKDQGFYNEIVNVQREKAKDYFDNYGNVSKLIVKYLN